MQKSNVSMMLRNKTMHAILAAAMLATGAAAQRKTSAPAPPTPPLGASVRTVNGYAQLEVNGVPFFIHAAAFPYFRLPPDLWERSLAEYRRLGINTIDLAIPWNWHEVRSGEFDFEGRSNPRRDLRRLLRLVAESELKLLVRPAAAVSSWKNAGVPDWQQDATEGERERAQRAFVARLAAELAAFAPEATLTIPDREARKEPWQKTVSGPVILAALPSAAAVEAWRAAGMTAPAFNEPQVADAPAAPATNTLVRTPVGMPPPVRVGPAEVAAAEFLAGLLATQPVPALVSNLRAGERAPEDDVRAAESAMSDALVRSRLFLAGGIRGLSYEAVQDSLNPAGFTPAGTNRFVRVDAALDINASRIPAARNIIRNGQLVDHWGAWLAAAHKRADIAVVTAPATEEFAGHWARLSHAALAATLSMKAVAPEVQSVETLLQSPLLIWNTLAAGGLTAEAESRLLEYARRGGTLVLYPRRPEGRTFSAVWAEPEAGPGSRKLGSGRVLESSEDVFAAVPTNEGLRESLADPATQKAAEEMRRWSRVAQEQPVVQRPASTGGMLLATQLVTNAGAKPLGERDREGAGLLSVINLGGETIEEELEVLSPRAGAKTRGAARLKIPIAVPPQESLLLPLHVPLCSAAKTRECDDEIIASGAEFLWAERDGKQLELTFYVPLRAMLRLRLERQPSRVRTDEMSVDGLWSLPTRQFEVPIPRGPAPDYIRVVRIQLPYEPHVPEKPDPDKVGRRDYEFAVADGVRFPLARDTALETHPPLVVLKGDRTGRMVMRGQNYDVMGRDIDFKVSGAIKADDGLGLDAGEVGFERIDLKPNGDSRQSGPGFLEGQVEARSGRDRRRLPLAFVAVDEKNALKYEFDFDRDGAVEWVLEDDHLRIAASPENGGRIVALVDKESGLSISTVQGLLHDSLVDETAEPGPPRDLNTAPYRAQWTMEQEQQALALTSPQQDGLTIEKQLRIAGKQAFDVRYRWHGPGLAARTLVTSMSVPVTLHGDHTTRFCWEKPRPENVPPPTEGRAPEMDCEIFEPRGRTVTVPAGITHIEVRTPGSSALRVEWPAGQMSVEMKNYSALLRLALARPDPGATNAEALVKFRVAVVE